MPRDPSGFALRINFVRFASRNATKFNYPQHSSMGDKAYDNRGGGVAPTPYPGNKNTVQSADHVDDSDRQNFVTGTCVMESPSADDKVCPPVTLHLLDEHGKKVGDSVVKQRSFSFLVKDGNDYFITLNSKQFKTR